MSLLSTNNPRQQRGSVTVLAAGIFVVVGLIAVGIVQLVVLLGERSQAQNAADASALAGVTRGQDLARTIAALNEAKLISYRDTGIWVDVGVRVGRSTARARALRLTTTPLQQAAAGRRTPVRAADWS